MVADGRSLFGGAQLAIDTTLVGAVHANGEPGRRATEEGGVALVAAGRTKERTTRSLWASTHGCVSWCWAWKLVGGRFERHTSS